MSVLVGVLLALGVGLFATVVRLDRDRAFYCAVTIVVGSYYVLFAAMGGSPHALVVEAAIGGLFVALAAAGFRSSLWVVVAALAGHGIFDLFHGDWIHNAGVPAWWPGFCAATTGWKGRPWTCWWTTSNDRRASVRSPIQPPVWWR